MNKNLQVTAMKCQTNKTVASVNITLICINQLNYHNFKLKKHNKMNLHDILISLFTALCTDEI